MLWDPLKDLGIGLEIVANSGVVTSIVGTYATVTFLNSGINGSVMTDDLYANSGIITALGDSAVNMLIECGPTGKINTFQMVHKVIWYSTNYH